MNDDPKPPTILDIAHVEEARGLSVNLAEVEDRENIAATAQPLSGLQRAALTVLIVLFALMLTLGALIVSLWVRQPAPPTTLDTQSLAAYRTLIELHNDTYREMFQLVIVSTLLPVVTLVAGYLFGVQKAE